MTEQSKSTAMDTVRSAAKATDLLDLINHQREAADILLSIARREEFDNPATAVRAAASAARMFSDVVAGLVVEERLQALQSEVDNIRSEAERMGRQGQGRHIVTPVEGGVSVISGEKVMLPTWGRQAGGTDA